MIDTADNRVLALQGSLILNELSDKKFPDIKDFQDIKIVDLQQLENIDSAGIAYITQIKTRFPKLCFVGVSDKTDVLADLYGLSFLFKS